MEAVLGVLSILIMIGAGFVLGKRRVIDEAGSVLLAKLIVNLGLPCYMFANLVQLFDGKSLIAILPLLVLPYLSTLLCYLFGHVCARLLRVAAGRRGTFTAMFSLSNIIFIGLPVNVILFGTAAIPYVLLTYIANTTLFWTVGVAAIKRDGAMRMVALPFGPADATPGPASKTGAAEANRKKTDAAGAFLEALRRLISPPLMGLLFALLFLGLSLKVPKLLTDATGFLGAMTTPLSMLFIGYVLSAMRWKNLRLDVAAFVLLVGRFALSPLAAVGVFWLARHSGIQEYANAASLASTVFTIQAAMPAMTQTAIVAKVYNADHEYAAVMTSFSTVVSMLSIPATMLVLRG